MDPLLSINYQTIVDFMEAAEGNYRNAIYITCCCTCKDEAGCRDFLFIPGHDCKPVIFPLKDAESFLGTKIDRSECAGILSSNQFIHLYSRWIDLTLTSRVPCPIQQILCLMNQW